MKRRERTRHLIELGGLIAKSGLVDLVNDDRTALYGAFLELALQLQPEMRDQVIALWHQRGNQAFKEEQTARDRQGGAASFKSKAPL